MSSVSSIAAASSQLQAEVIRQQIGYAVAAKALEATRQQGEAVAQLLEAASRMSKAFGKGTKLDAVA